MKEISDVTCCVVDHGLFCQMARRMADDCKRVLHWNPDCRAFPSIKQGCIAGGFERVEQVREFWPMIDEIDLFCFPDSSMAGLQTYLASVGKAVWGSRWGEAWEQKRQFFMQTVEALGLDVAPYAKVVGLDDLREYLRDKEDKYVKVSHWRGDMETTHWRNWRLDQGWLDWMAVNLGPVLKNSMTFLVFDKIDTELEIGADTYNVNGQWPSLMLNGIEGKDKTYFSVVTPTKEMPEQLQTIFRRFGPLLADEDYRNQISFEVRVKGDQAYWIDATQRGGMPSTASQHLLWKNFPDIVWAGANGEMINPNAAAKYSIEVMVTSKGGHDTWDTVEIPAELEPWCRFSNCCYVDGLYCFPPDELMGNDLGWLAAIGDTPDEVFQAIKDHADLLPDGLNADVESLSAIIQEIDSAMEEGIPVTTDSIPEPASVL